MQFTDEQRAIIEHISGPNKHLLVTARAGAAKTTTLVAAAEALPSTVRGLVLAFNKKIADEMKLRLPPNFRAMTLNGCGFDAWRRYIGRSTKVLADKNFFILKEFIDQLSAEDREAAWNSMSDLKRAISSAKTYGYIPQPLPSTYRPLMSSDEFYNEALFIETSQLERELIDATLTESWKQTCAGVLDFDDMVLAPAVAPVSFPHYDFILVDEAQDLAGINHVMLKKLVRGPTRLVAVGDPCQPLGTLITRVKKKGDRWNEPQLEQVPIEEIALGDTVLGHNANGSFMFNRRIEGITRKPFEGNLVVAGPTRYTPNHHCYTRFASLADHWCIYLMRKGDAYRVGKARMSYGEQGLGPQIRAKAEGADAMWILSTYEDETSAFIAEAVIQTEFGLSDLCFIDPLRPWLSSFWKEMQTLNLESRARACLTAYHREFDYPLWTSGDSIPAKRPFITRACNLLSGCEFLLYEGEKKTGRESWTPLPITYEPYSGDVISFTISDNHLYVADNIVTHNCQAIYGFRGADSASMTSLKNLFDAPNLYLTTSFRCSKAVCINAQWRAPDMRYPEWAAEGSVQHRTIWSVADIPDEAAILCRNNAPLFSMAIQLLRAGRHPELKGRDMLASVLTKMKKLGRADTKREALLPKIEKLREQLRKKQRDQRLADDTIECILVFVNETDTLGAAMAFAEAIATREGRIKLYTGHGAKGLEFDTVLFLDQHLLDIKRGQDANVKYVIETRAKRDLIYVTSEGFQHVDTETEASSAA